MTPDGAHGAKRPAGRRILLLGATGTIGRAVARVLLARGDEVVCFGRNRASAQPAFYGGERIAAPSAPVDLADARGATAIGVRVAEPIWRFGDVTEETSLRRDAFRGDCFDAVVSCLASRTGAPDDAWAIDSGANRHAIAAAQEAGVSHFVLLSAICVQKPRLAFQHAKRDAEQALIASGMTYSIVRPTAFFKSLSGQIERVKAGKPYLVFGDGRLTACKPISDADLATYMADCLGRADRRNRILPIGGPGPAITPVEQGEALFALAGAPPRFRRVPVALFDVAGGVLGGLGRISRTAADKAEFARIARYYATESMLVWDDEKQRYDAEATPSFGAETLFGFYERAFAGDAAERVDQRLF